MNVKINDLMSTRVIKAQLHHSIDHVRALIERNRVHALPIVGPDDEVLGVVSTADLIGPLKGNTHVSRIMNRDVLTVPAYNEISVAARIMRKNRIHHLVVTHEKKVVGMISSFDLLSLVEDRRFVPKSAPKQPRRESLKSA